MILCYIDSPAIFLRMITRKVILYKGYYNCRGFSTFFVASRNQAFVRRSQREFYYRYVNVQMKTRHSQEYIYKIVKESIMDNITTLNELRDNVIQEMKRRNYTLAVIRRFRYNCNRFERYMQDRGLQPNFSEAVGAAYLKDTFGYDDQTKPGQLKAYALSNVSTIKKLGEYRLFRTFHSEGMPWTVSYEWAGEDKKYTKLFIDREGEYGKSKNTITSRRHALRYFYEFICTLGKYSAKEVNGQILSDYVRSRKENSHNYLCNLLTGLKLYFRFLYQQGYCVENIELMIPVINRRQNVNVPALWSEDELHQLLTSIDRSNPAGKRDYAILLLTVQLGIRVSDIAALKLSSLDFSLKIIKFIQQKTEKTVVYPMLDDVGWALIDWLRYGRAISENQYVFLTCHSIPMEFADGAAIGRILNKRMKLSGIRKEAKNVTAGMHSIRHALARRLVEKDIGLNDVVSIMGHRNTNATSKYVRTDIKGLRECALSIGGEANEQS